jgi:hypothetical protein
VIVFGEPGLEKDNVASMVHFCSSSHAGVLVQLNFDRLDVLWERGGRPGLLSQVGDGTVIIRNLAKVRAQA